MTRIQLLKSLASPVMACALVLHAGCSRDVRLAQRKVRTVTVEAKTIYGVTLDESASPQQVTHVLLRAIREDFLATTAEEREAALDKQFDICAANVIQSRNRGSMARDEFVHNVVYRWTPTVSHYVNDFDTEWEKAKPRLVRVVKKPADLSGPNASTCEVAIEVADPDGDPNAGVIIVVWLAQDENLWRVVHLGFEPGRRSLGSRVVRKITVDPSAIGG